MFKYEQRGIEVEPNIITFAFRYALGRMSMAPTIVADTIRKNINLIPTLDLHGMAHEIEMEYEVDGLGEDCDVRTWMNLQRDIEKELERREHEKARETKVD